MVKGYKIVITNFLGLPTKYNYSASAFPLALPYCSHIVFGLQPLEVDYNYYMHFDYSLLLLMRQLIVCTYVCN